MTDIRIRFENISKWYGSLRVVEDLDLEIAGGEFVSLLGPSGSGKTTLLMMLAGFETPTKGAIYVDGQRLDNLPAYKRNMGVVFQNYALFPHMTIAENIGFPLKMRGIGRAEIDSRVAKALDTVQLSSLGGRRPAQLSGGQQQRVALARALVFEPSVVLMDEPLGALDKQLREQMQLDIRALHNRLGLTIVFVTHDQSEALTMSDRIAVFNKGKIEQIGSPRDVYDSPKTQFVAEFIGETNLLPGSIIESEKDRMVVALSSGEKLQLPADNSLAIGKSVLVSIRPERFVLQSPPFDDDVNRLAAKVIDCVYQGDHLRVQLQHSSGQLIVRQDRKSREWERGSEVNVRFLADDCRILRHES